MNNITIAGNVGRDGELRQVGEYTVLSFPVASTKKVKGEERTTWFDCSLWGKRAQSLSPYIVKGTRVVVVGEVSLDVYKKQDGTQGAKISVNVNDVTLMGGGQTVQQQAPQPVQQPRQQPQAFDDFEDDIPF